MARQLINLTNDAHQKHTVTFSQWEVIVTLRYLPTVQIWTISAEYGSWSAVNQKLSLGVLHFLSENMPFDFLVEDASGLGLDPLRLDDFSSGRCKLYILDPEDMKEIRGTSVKLDPPE